MSQNDTDRADLLCLLGQKELIIARLIAQIQAAQQENATLKMTLETVQAKLAPSEAGGS